MRYISSLSLSSSYEELPTGAKLIRRSVSINVVCVFFAFVYIYLN